MPGVVLRGVNDAVYGGGDVGVEAILAPEMKQARALLVQAWGILLDGLGGERHQALDFFGRTPPILRENAVERQIADRLVQRTLGRHNAA